MKNLLLPLLACGSLSMLAQTPRLVVPVGHTKFVTAVAFSDKYILTSSADNTAKLWDAAGHEIQTYSEHGLAVVSVAFSPDGKSVLTGSYDGTAKLRDLAGEAHQTFAGHKNYVHAVAFSPDGKFVLTGSEDKTAKLWNIATSKVAQTFAGHTGAVLCVAFSPDGKTVLTGSADKTARIWNVADAKSKTFAGHTAAVFSVAFSPDGQSILTGSDDKTARLWKVADLSSKSLPNGAGVHAVAFAPDDKGNTLLTAGFDGTVRLWDLTGKQLLKFKTPSGANAAAFSPNGKYIVTASEESTAAMLWDRTGVQRQSLSGHTRAINAMAVSQDGNVIAAGNRDGTARRWSLMNNNIQMILAHKSQVNAVSLSADGQLLLTGSDDNTAKLWGKDKKAERTFQHNQAVRATAFLSQQGEQYAVLTGSFDRSAKLLKWEGGNSETKTFKYPERVTAFTISPADSGRYIVAGSDAGTLSRWELSADAPATFRVSSQINAMAASADGLTIVTGCDDGFVQLWTKDGQLVQTIEHASNEIHAVAFSPDGKKILTGCEDGKARLWDILSAKEKVLSGHTASVVGAAFLPMQHGKFVVTASNDGAFKLWESATGELLATLVALDSVDWVVFTPDNLFDASPGAMRRLYFVAGQEIVELEQLKERYYEPYLLTKILGHNKEPLRSAIALSELEIYPEMSIKLSDNNTILTVDLVKRSGGIGKLSVFVNGKEGLEDANPQRQKSVTIDLKAFAKSYLPGDSNKISLRAFNSEGWLKSRALDIYASPPLIARGTASGSNEETVLGSNPSLYAIVVGTAEYDGTKLDLQFADNDATRFSQALKAAAPKIFDDRVHVVLLNTNAKDPERQDISSKATVKKAFEQFAVAKAQDVLVIYFSGHGVNYGVAEKSQFYYLTKDINSEDLSNPDIRNNYAISSAELTEWIKAVPALKQVMILDACNSGKIIEDLAAGSKDLSATQARALDRMKDRTGMYILAGSAADKLSYEATEYGQGLLTYTLLLGMSGRALTDDKRVDVMKLFQYSRDLVPELAKGINGIQTPVLAFPDGGASIDIGIVNGSVKIPVAEKKPVFIRSSFHDENDLDALGLTNALEEYFRAATVKGGQADLVYVDASEYENGYSIRGSYTVKDDEVQVKANLTKNGVIVGKFTVPGKKTALPALVESILEKVTALIN